MTLRLQVCAQCGAVQYPARSVCGNCLSGALETKPVQDTGSILSWSRGHISVLPDFKDALPAIIARVDLDAGPRMIVMLREEACISARVRIARGAKSDLFIAKLL